MELLRDPAWQFVGAIVAVLTIFVTVYYAQRVGKRLGYKVTNSSPILTISEENVGDLKVFYMDRQVHSVQLLEVVITNVGTQEIAPPDFVTPLVLSFNEGAEVLSTTTLNKEPSELIVEATYSENVVQLEPTLLNPKDTFSIKILVSGHIEGPLVTGRIKGVSKIKKLPTTPNFTLWISIVGCLNFVFLLSFMHIWEPSEMNPFLILTSIGLAVVISFHVIGTKR